MTKYYSEILKIKNWELKKLINELEHKTSKPKQDLKLFSDIKEAIYYKIKELNLDPFDSNSLEIYHALSSKLDELDKKLVKYLRTKSAHYLSAEANLSSGLRLFLSDLTKDLKVLSVKNVFYKKYLKSNPPKTSLRALGYRSIDSLIKKEPIELVLVTINRMESISYLNKFYAHHKTLKITDFEERPIRILMATKRYQEIISTISGLIGRDFVLSLETGTVIINDLSNQPLRGQTTKVLIEILDDILLLQSLTSYLKLSEFRPDFSLRVADVFEHEPTVYSKLHSMNLPFKLVHKLSDQYRSNLDFDFPFSEDFKLTNYKEILPHIINDFKFFIDSDHLYFSKDSKNVSLNILDVATNLMHANEFHERSTKNLSRSLYDELMGRYLNKAQLETIFEQESS